MDKYISFLDLLGTKALAQYDENLYIQTIHEFGDALFSIADICDFQKVNCHAFSDCAYIECDDLKGLCDFITLLRKELLSKRICFNAAICVGDMIIRRRNNYNGNVDMLDFSGPDTVTVYSKQTKFTGAGIYVDSQLHDHEDIKNNLIDSKFVTLDKNGHFVYHLYKDIKYGINDIMLLTYVLHMLLENYILNKRASRYYIAMLFTCFKEIWENSNSKMKKDVLNKILSCISQIDDIEYRNSIMLSITDNICTRKPYEDLNEKISEVHEYLNQICSILPINNLYNIVQYDDQIISSQNKKVIAQFITQNKIISNGF